ncbi:MAG TPA: toll/interleukin-1 receptor domain-containing protein [Pyrinomonadaceae bacterium]|nr:toll/interleukin-1 receptor domain-containing protein [Pyrinomonadaceae bacterium]
MRRTCALLVLSILAALMTACGGAEPGANTANTSVNVNRINNVGPNSNGTPEANTSPVNTNSTVNTNGQRTNANGGNTSFIIKRDGNVSTTNANGSQTAPTPEKNDRITVEYPNLLLQGDGEDSGKVTFMLEEVTGRVYSTTTTNGNRTERTDRPDKITGARPGTLRPEADPDKFDVYVEVNLLTQGLSKTDPPNLKRPYTGKREVWEWRLRPEPSAREGSFASFRFQVNVTWQAKTPDVSTRELKDVWGNRFEVDVGPPASRVNAALYTSPLFAAGGFVTMGLSRRRRKGLAEAEAEESEETGDKEEAGDEVSGTVYAPGQAAQGNSFLVQVFIHLPEQAEALDEMAREADEDARRRISSRLQKKVERGTELTFHLQMPGLVVDDDVQSCVWEGEPVCVQFGVSVPEDCKPKNIIGTVTVSEMTVPIGHLRFKFKVTEAAEESEDEEAAPSLEPQPVANLTRYQQAFISYASKDRQEVLKRVQMLNVAKIKFFQDLLTLEPGDEWEKLLYEYIDRSDVFFLFWSKAASESEWVRKEVEYAIKRRADKELPDPEIIPVIIEGPPAVKPPQELSYLHFNDKLIYFINTAEGA